MTYGSKPTDGRNLTLEPQEMESLCQQDARAKRFVKKYMGAQELIRGLDRYCLWVEDRDVEEARQVGSISQRLERVRAMRLASKKAATRELASVPHRFEYRAYKPTDSIIVPSVSSERREYIPIGFLGPDTVISNLAFAVYEAEPWLFGLLTSRMHMVWTRAVGGKMKTDYRYSNTIVYNNFPVRELTDAEKQELTQLALRVLDVREYHCEKTLAELYDPELMPANLREAHEAVDAFVDGLYSKRMYETDEERLSDLFAMYEDMIAAEEAAKPVKRTRKKK